MAIKFLNSTEITSTLTVSNGQIVLSGTGRIQGIDTVSSNTDAANKLYVDNAVAGVPVGDITGVIGGTGLTGGGYSGTVTLNVIGGDGITANNDNITVNSTVVRTSGAQTIAGAKTFSSAILGNISGNAGTATTLSTARTIAGVSFNGSANISLNNNAITNGAGYTSNTGDITSVTAGTGLSGGGSSGAITITNAAPNIVQTTVSGNAGSATVLQTARTIAGVSFNGSANISLNNNAITNGAGYTTNVGDITAVTAGTNMSGGGTSGAVTLNADSTNLSLTRTSAAVTIVSSTGTSAVIPAATITLSGVLTAATQDIGGAKTFKDAVTCQSTFTGTNFILSSDKRLKENVIDLEPKAISAEWKSFTMKGSSEDYRVGVIAQELEVSNPEFVVTNDEGFKSVKYIDLLIAKIAELEARLEKAGI